MGSADGSQWGWSWLRLTAASMVSWQVGCGLVGLRWPELGWHSSPLCVCLSSAAYPDLVFVVVTGFMKSALRDDMLSLWLNFIV